VTRTSPIQCVGSIFQTSQNTNVKITLIAAGRYHVIAYSSVTGQYFGWGQNTVGQLGNGTLTAWTIPVNGSAFAALLNQNNYDKPNILYAGDTTSFILGNSGTMYSFGLNSNGQLGESSTTNQLLGNQIDTSNMNGTLISFCSTEVHSLFLTNNGNQLFISLFSLIMIFVILF